MSGSINLSNSASARIVEIFSSLQGEGIYLGERQIFVRFGGCNLHCDYCDEPRTIPIPSGEVMELNQFHSEVSRLKSEKKHRSLSWTGGEPLLHVPFLLSVMPWVRKEGLLNYLETNGTRVEAFKQVRDLCDIVAMDIKLPSSTGKELWSEHLEFLRALPKKSFAKVILTDKTTEAEWRQVIRILQESSPDIPLILQPATPIREVRTIKPALAIKFLRQAQSLLKEVRLIPQWHPIWGLR
jgi:organic radical activating enzyme